MARMCRVREPEESTMGYLKPSIAATAAAPDAALRPEQTEPSDGAAEAAAGDGSPTGAPVDDVIAGDVGAAGSRGSAGPLGRLDLTGALPEGLDLAAFPDAPAGPKSSVHRDISSFSAGPECVYQCITSGVAYPRGFGAELVVETSVPANIFLSVVADTSGDGAYGGSDDYHASTNSYGMTSELSWSLDHLDPGQEYVVMAAATDAHGDTSYAYGSFTTLSTRTAVVSLGDLTVQGGPGNISTSPGVGWTSTATSPTTRPVPRASTSTRASAASSTSSSG